MMSIYLLSDKPPIAGTPLIAIKPGLPIGLAGVVRSFLVHGTVTLSILSCAFLPLFKGGHKKPDQFTSYRAIAGASQLLKLWDYVVLELWGGSLSTDSMQFGFKKKTSTAHCSWLVMGVCGHFLQRRSQVLWLWWTAAWHFLNVLSASFSKSSHGSCPTL